MWYWSLLTRFVDKIFTAQVDRLTMIVCSGNFPRTFATNSTKNWLYPLATSRQMNCIAKDGNVEED